jgi:DNA-binding protein YbaB
MFGKIGDMYKLQKQAKAIKKELKHTHIEADSHGVRVTVDGEQKVVSIEIVDQGLLQNPKKLEDVLKEALNKALDKAQKVAAEQMKGVMGDLGFPGL